MVSGFREGQDQGQRQGPFPCTAPSCSLRACHCAPVSIPMPYILKFRYPDAPIPLSPLFGYTRIHLLSFYLHTNALIPYLLTRGKRTFMRAPFLESTGTESTKQTQTTTFVYAASACATTKCGTANATTTKCGTTFVYAASACATTKCGTSNATTTKCGTANATTTKCGTTFVYAASACATTKCGTANATTTKCGTANATTRDATIKRGIPAFVASVCGASVFSASASVCGASVFSASAKGSAKGASVFSASAEARLVSGLGVWVFK